MPQFLLLFALAFVASAGRGVASGVEDCQLLATSVIVGAVYDGGLVRSCNGQAQCLNFKLFIEQQHKTAPGLTCAGATRAVPPVPKQFEPIYGNACSWAATGLTTDTWIGDRDALIALCRQYPDKDDCRSYQAYVRQNRQTTVDDLKCE